MLRTCSWALVALLLVGVAEARDYRTANLEIMTPWARATAPTAPAGGGFVVIKNTGPTADRLVSARSAIAETVQVHEMKMDGNVMRMRELESGLEIPAGATVSLAPGGFHLMLMGLKQPLRQGSTVPVTLVFEKAGSIDIELAVEGLGAAKPSEHKH